MDGLMEERACESNSIPSVIFDFPLLKQAINARAQHCFHIVMQDPLIKNQREITRLTSVTLQQPERVRFRFNRRLNALDLSEIPEGQSL